MGGQDGHAALARRPRKPAVRMQPTETPRACTSAYIGRRDGDDAFLDGHFPQGPQAKRPKQALGQCSPKAKAAAPRGGAGMMLNFLGLTPTNSTSTGSASGRAEPARERELTKKSASVSVRAAAATATATAAANPRTSKLIVAGRDIVEKLRGAARARGRGDSAAADRLAQGALEIKPAGAFPRSQRERTDTSPSISRVDIT